ncbi:MAG TPA: 2-succinyl-5-enolpyruvyl-6-hydroxy-3-cyclohexene-1-carboxylic-acid synthase, partial [Nitriliruptoraceae bacterium]|nr:2-succinyl-5-enolpyruvyl-6-hydroxy-3-cyclohexene-1-carboxylic-acid synthase [Nitriliruptoraceae bacterium]
MADIDNPSTAMATAVVDECARNGIADVVLCPGSRSTALAIAAVRHPDLRIHVRHDERSAGFLAIGLARGSGRPAVVVTTSGTAVANLAPAVAEADAAGVPLLVMSADRPVELHDVGANQTLRQARLFDGMVRWSVDLPAAGGAAGEPALWRSTACRAFAAASGVGGGHVGQVGSGGGAGPVHCNLAFREPTIPGLDDGRTTTAPYPHPIAGRDDGSPWTTHVGAPVDVGGIVEDLLTTLDGARVLVVAGDTPAPIAGLEDLPWPVVAEPTAGTHLGVGLAHGSLLLADDGFINAHRPDVVLRLGHPTLSRAALVNLADVPAVQVSASGIVDPSRQAIMAITAPAHEIVTGVLAALADHGTGEVAAATGAASSGSAAAAVHDTGARGGAASAEAPGTDSEPPDEWLQTWRRASRLAAAVVAEHLDVVDPAESAVARVVAAAVGGRALVVASSLPIRDLADYAAPPADDAAPPADDAAPPAADAALPADDA